MRPREQEVLDALKAYMDEYGWPPSIRDLNERTEVSSTSHMNYLLGRLETKGYIVRGAGKRMIRLTDYGRAA